MQHCVLKFGGSCSSSVERLAQTFEIIKFHVDSGDNPDVVASAIGASPDSSKKMTDFLLYVSSLIKKADYSIALELVRKAKAMYVERGNYFGIEHHVFDAVFEDLEKICSRSGVRDFRKNFVSPVKKRGLVYLALDDFVAPFGELAAIELYAGGLNAMGIKAKAVDSAKSGGFISDSNFKSAKLADRSLNELIALEFKRLKNRNPNTLLVYSGFNAVDALGNCTTLGRDGSNVTALAVAASTNANYGVIYSDDSLLPIDPKIVKNGKPIRQLSYGELIALSNGGVKTIPPSMIYVLRKHQRLPPIYMRSTRDYRDAGTLIMPNPKPGFAKAMAVRDNVSYREFPVQDDKQAKLLMSMIADYEGVSVLSCADDSDVNGRKISFIYQVDTKFVERLKKEPDLLERMCRKIGGADSEFRDNPDQYFRQTMFRFLKQVFNGENFESVQLHNAHQLTIVGHDIGTSYAAISEVMEILGRVQPQQPLKRIIHRLPIERGRHYIRVIIPRGLENVAAEIYNALYVKA